jgi:phosphoribosylformylglycinamidine synthase
MGGELGLDIDLGRVPAETGLSDTQRLYSESAGRFLVTVNPQRCSAFEEIFAGQKIARIGSVTDSTRLRCNGQAGQPILDEDVLELKEAWKRPFGALI